MKLEDVKVGMRVRGQNMFGCLYRVTKIDGRMVGLEHRTGNLVMRGGKRVDEVLTYWAHPRILTPVVDATSEDLSMASKADTAVAVTPMVDATGAELLSTASNAATAVAVAEVCLKLLYKTWANKQVGSRGMIKGLRADLAKIDAGLKALKAELRAERAATMGVERVPRNLSAGLVSRRDALVPWQMEGLPASEGTRKSKPSKSKKRKE